MICFSLCIVRFIVFIKIISKFKDEFRRIWVKWVRLKMSNPFKHYMTIKTFGDFRAEFCAICNKYVKTDILNVWLFLGRNDTCLQK